MPKTQRRNGRGEYPRARSRIDETTVECAKTNPQPTFTRRPASQSTRYPIFYIDQLHHNLGVKMLNDRFGIQTRGGCSCAGTYGHYLLNVSKEQSKKITDKIDAGDYSSKPGWIRLSIHPTMTDAEIKYIIHAIKTLASNHSKWQSDYEIDYAVGSIKHKNKQLESKLANEVDNCYSGKFY